MLPANPANHKHSGLVRPGVNPSCEQVTPTTTSVADTHTDGGGCGGGGGGGGSGGGANTAAAATSVAAITPASTSAAAVPVVSDAAAAASVAAASASACVAAPVVFAAATPTAIILRTPHTTATLTDLAMATAAATAPWETSADVGAWRCEACGFLATDAEVNVPCCAPFDGEIIQTYIFVYIYIYINIYIYIYIYIYI